MSVSMQNGVTSPVTGQVNFGWISDAWRLFSAQMGVWIVATLILFAPSVVLVIIFYAMMWSTMFPGGLPGATQPVPGANPFPAPGANPAFMGNHFGTIFAWEFGFIALYSIWAAYMYGGLYRMAVQQVRGLPIEVRDVFRGGALFGRMLGGLWLLGLGAYVLEAVCIGPFGLLVWQHGPAAALIVAGIVGVVLFLALMLTLPGMLLPSFALIADGDGVITAIKRSFRAMKTSWPAAAGFVFVMGLLVYVSEIPCGIGLLATIPMVFLITALAYRDMLGMPNMVAPVMPGYAQAGEGVWPPAPGAWPPPPQAQQYPSQPPLGQQYPPTAPPLQSLSGEPLDDPRPTPPERG
ncbi:MAG: hypothetical protein ACRYFS_10185 [Janthinobacterium lividum]